MILTNEFTVSAEADKVWRHLKDLEEVAKCLPGASVEASDAADVYEGSMRLKIGPMTVTYRGTARLAEVDDARRRAVYHMQAREDKGQGTATATITNRVEPFDGKTKVTVETDLHITGPQARFAQGVMEDVATRVLGEFSRRLEEQIVAPVSAAEVEGAAPAAAALRPPPPEREPEALDMGAVFSQTTAWRCARIGLPALLALRPVAAAPPAVSLRQGRVAATHAAARPGRRPRPQAARAAGQAVQASLDRGPSPV